MKKSVLQIYAAAVCFVTAIIATISGGTGVYDIVQLSVPAMSVSGRVIQAHQDNRAFARWYARRYGRHERSMPQGMPEDMQEHYLDEAPEVAPLPQDQAELTQLREQSFASMLAAERHNAIRDLVREAITLVIAALLFWVHWRLLRRLHREQE